MTTAGLLVMLLSVGIVVSLFSWCIWKVFTTPNEAEKVHGLEIKPPDIDADK